jgi:hypothetical protein
MFLSFLRYRQIQLCSISRVVFYTTSMFLKEISMYFCLLHNIVTANNYFLFLLNCTWFYIFSTIVVCF